MAGTNLETILNGLNANPIFRMSLGSKELFHSNFLEYLFSINKEAFIKMINDFNLGSIQLQNGVVYQIGRELENFDLCIYHTVNGKEDGKKVYDLVIENKVKSIPYKTQLMDYVGKAQGSVNCKFILLTLSEEFPDKDDKDVIKHWKVINYKNLKESIKSQYIGNPQISPRDQTYIKDYCDFIELLDNLKTVLIPNDQQRLFVQNDKELLESVRLHDLYIKLRCSWFAVNLRNRLQNIGIRTKIINKYEEREYGFVNINVAINQGNGQIAAWICDCNKKVNGKKMTNMFEIVIQGNQYRHGINQENISVEVPDKYNKLNALYNRLPQLPDKRPIEFLNFQGAYNAGNYLGISPLPNKIKNFQKKCIPKSGPFNCYNDAYIYRYKEIDDISIGELLNWMVREVTLISKNIPNLI